MPRKKTAEELDRDIAEALAFGQRPPHPAPMSIDRFDREWIRQEEQDKVDSFGAAEYRRVKSAWISAGCPKALEDFIPGSESADRSHATIKLSGSAKSRALAMSPTLIAEKYRPFARSPSWRWWIHLPGSVSTIGEGSTEAKAWQAAADFLSEQGAAGSSGPHGA